MSTTEDTRIVTPEGRFLYPHLFEPRAPMVAGKPKGDPVYAVDLLLDPNTTGELKAMAVKVAKAKWPSRDLKAAIKDGDLMFPIKSGAVLKAKAEKKGKKGDLYDGKEVLKATSSAKFKPQVVDKAGQPILNASDVYGGCYGHLQVNFVAWDGNGENIKDSVKAYINCVLKSRDGERIGGGDPKTVFAGIIGKTSTEDPTEGLDDEIGL